MNKRRPSVAAVPHPGLPTLLALLIGALAGAAQAQTPAAAPGAAPAMAEAPGKAAEAEEEKGQRRAWTIAPRLTLGETFTDNALLRNANKRSDWITEISPGLHVSGESARLKAYFDYSRRELLYAKESDRKNSRNALNTFGTFKAIENLLFLDFSAGITQQALSAFGTQTAGASVNNANESETRTIRLSPYLKSNLGGLFNYELRYTATAMRTEAARATGMDQSEWRAHFDGDTPYSRILWAVDASRQNYDYSQGTETESTTARLKLTYVVDPTLKLSAMGGRESNNFATIDTETHSTGGFGVEWNPTGRTKLFLERERRFFGYGHRFTFEHRTPRTALNFSDVRNVTATPTAMAQGSLGNIYDLLFAQFASIEPDPVQRDILVMNYLNANGISPNTQVNSGFFNSGPTVSRRQSLSYALLGVRNTLTLTATQGETQRLGLLTAAGEDLAGTGSVRQRGLSLALSHRFSPLSSLSVQASRQSSQSPSLSTTIRNLNATFSHKLSSNTTVTLGARRVLFDSPTVPYTETAFIGTLRMQF